MLKNIRVLLKFCSNKLKEDKVVDGSTFDREKLKVASSIRFFPPEMREDKILELINISVKDYASKFKQWSRYAPTMVVESNPKISKFVLVVSKMVVKE